MTSGAPQRSETFRTTRRAVDLLDAALIVLREEVSEERQNLAGVVEHVGLARERLVAASYPGCQGVEEAVVSCNTILDRALQLAQASPDLPPRQAQSLATVARTQAILYPIAHQRDPRAAVPPPLPPRRRKTKVSEEKEGLERRRSPRVPQETEVTFEGLSNFYAGFTEDISAGGIFVSTYNLQPLGTKMEVTFTLPTGHVINAWGEVRWLRDPRDPDDETTPGMGIMFEDLLPEDKEAIEEFAKARAPMFYDDDDEG